MSFKIIAIGELLWDLLPTKKVLGGAPANFAYHTHAMGAESLIVSCIGNDALGRELRLRLAEMGLRTDGITTDPIAPTGVVSVALDARGVPNFTIHENVAWDFLAPSPAVLAEAGGADAVYYGSLGQRHSVARGVIRKFLQSAPPAALRVFDINLRQNFYTREIVVESLQAANVLKLNNDELPVVARLVGLTGSEASLLDQLAVGYGLRVVALTRGDQGSALWVNGEFISRPVEPIAALTDTVGAGDSYTAALVMGLLAGHEPEQIIDQAHRVASFVCTQFGGTPALPEELRRLFTVADGIGNTKNICAA